MKFASYEIISYRFNSLFGSNTPPKAFIKSGFTNNLVGTAVHFNYLHRVKFDNDIDKQILIDHLNEVDEVPTGSLHWNKKLNNKEVYVKCKGDKY